MANELNETVGDRDLCAWRVAPGWVWVQTRRPEVAKLLGQRAAFRPVAWGVNGGYLRTFEVQMTLKQMEDCLSKLRLECPRISTENRGPVKAKSSERSFSHLRV